MKYESTGAGTSKAEILNVSPHGLWLLVGESEYFLDYGNFPWFRKATLSQLFNVELHHGEHLYWPELDVDLDLERIMHPENYPLVARND
jgi:hypothetical protein